MLTPEYKSLYDEYDIRPNNLLVTSRKVKPNRVKYIDIYINNEDHSRYMKIRKLLSDNKTFHETYRKYNIPKSDEDLVYVTKPQDVNRLDLVSYKMYGDARYWWVIALANNIIDPFNIGVNIRLRVPKIISLYLGGSILSDG